RDRNSKNKCLLEEQSEHSPLCFLSFFSVPLWFPLVVALIVQKEFRFMNRIYVAFGATILASLVGLGSVGRSRLPHLGGTPAQAATDRRPPAAPARERVDSHGDPLPDGVVARIGTLRFRPAKGGGPCAVVFAAQGKTLISIHGSNTLHLWDLATGKEQNQFTYGAGQQACQDLDISADGKRLAVAGYEGVQVWDLSGEARQPHWLKKNSTRRMEP